MENQENIQGGAFQVARKLFQSELWVSKPSSWKVIWIYILGRVNHRDDNTNKRGEGFFQWTRELSHIGDDITYDMIKKASSYFVKSGMVSTKRSTRGVRIKVLKYNIYQSLDNYSNTEHGTKKALRKHLESTTIDKNVKNDKNTIAEASSAPFSLKDEIKKLEDSPRRDLNIIAMYLDNRKPDIQTKDQLSIAIKRHLRGAQQLIPFTDNQILEAVPKAKTLTNEWTLETLIKILTK